MPGLEKHPRLSPPGSGWEVVRGTYVILSLWGWDRGRTETNGLSPEREGAGGGGRGFSHLPPLDGLPVQRPVSSRGPGGTTGGERVCPPRRAATYPSSL